MIDVSGDGRRPVRRKSRRVSRGDLLERSQETWISRVEHEGFTWRSVNEFRRQLSERRMNMIHASIVSHTSVSELSRQKWLRDREPLALGGCRTRVEPVALTIGETVGTHIELDLERASEAKAAREHRL